MYCQYLQARFPKLVFITQYSFAGYLDPFTSSAQFSKSKSVSAEVTFPTNHLCNMRQEIDILNIFPVTFLSTSIFLMLHDY